MQTVRWDAYNVWPKASEDPIRYKTMPERCIRAMRRGPDSASTCDETGVRMCPVIAFISDIEGYWLSDNLLYLKRSSSHIFVKSLQKIECNDAKNNNFAKQTRSFQS